MLGCVQTSVEEQQRLQQASQKAYNEYLAKNGSPFKHVSGKPRGTSTWLEI
jgi:hypothetical protein